MMRSNLKRSTSAIALAFALGVAPSIRVQAAGLGPNGGNGTSGGAPVSVTAASPNIVVNPTPGTGTFTIGATVVLNAQTGTTYTVVASDCGKLVSFNNASAVAVTLPQATGSFAAGCAITFQNRGAGTATITPNTSTINGSASLALTQNQGCDANSDGTNWQISSCTAFGSGGTPAGSGTEVQYRNAGAFGAIAGSSWNGSILTLPPLATSGLNMSGTAGSVVNLGASFDIQANGTSKITISAGSILFGAFSGWGSGGAGMGITPPTATVPSVFPNYFNSTTGLGAGAANTISGIVSGAEITRTASTGMAMQAGVFTPKAFTVSTLPASPATGSIAVVTDQTAACTELGTPAGSGSNVCVVVYTGAAWKDL